MNMITTVGAPITSNTTAVATPAHTSFLEGLLDFGGQAAQIYLSTKAQLDAAKTDDARARLASRLEDARLAAEAEVKEKQSVGISKPLLYGGIAVAGVLLILLLRRK
jgi:hypothetical protein